MVPAQRQTTQTKMEPIRRGSKPLVEKKRRARINNSLSELESLIIQNNKKKTGRVEKADILEMTVKYIQSLTKQQNEVLPKPIDSDSDSRFHMSGYMECVTEVSRYLATNEELDKSIVESLRKHLLSKLHHGDVKSSEEPKDDQPLDFSHTMTEIDEHQPSIELEGATANYPSAAHDTERVKRMRRRRRPVTPTMDTGSSNSLPSLTRPPSQFSDPSLYYRPYEMHHQPQNMHSGVHLIPNGMGQMSYMLPGSNLQYMPTQFPGRYMTPVEQSLAHHYESVHQPSHRSSFTRHLNPGAAFYHITDNRSPLNVSPTSSMSSMSDYRPEVLFSPPVIPEMIKPDAAATDKPWRPW